MKRASREPGGPRDEALLASYGGSSKAAAPPPACAAAAEPRRPIAHLLLGTLVLGLVVGYFLPALYAATTDLWTKYGAMLFAPKKRVSSSCSRK